MSEFDLTNQIIILELVHRSACPLSNSQIGDYFSENNLAHYFTVQSTLSDLVERQFLEPENSGNITFYSLTEAAQKALSSFGDRLNESLSKSIDRYFAAHGLEIRDRYRTRAFYDRTTDGGCQCFLSFREDGRQILELSLHVASEEAARTICANWSTKRDDVYTRNMDTLLT